MKLNIFKDRTAHNKIFVRADKRFVTPSVVVTGLLLVTAAVVPIIVDKN